MIAEKIWWILAGAVVVWYSTVTIYVGIRGAIDIKEMLGRLKAQKDGDQSADKA